jgi:KH/beta-lactamase-domain protein
MEILEKVKSLIPSTVSRIELEASEIVVYTKDKEFFLSYEPAVKAAVDAIKKRIEVRPESNLTLDQEYVKQKIAEIVPAEAKIRNVYFEPERSIVIIAAEKPGLVIGKGGETFRQIKKETFWVPRIERVPPIRSDVVDGIRKMMHAEVKFRKEFLNRVGESIFGERKAARDWIRIITLGGCREVGRSCMLVETPKSKVMIDCGIKAGATNSEVFPIFNTKEFDYTELDAIIASHAHLDHVGCIPILYERGFDGPLYLTTPTLDLATLLWLDYIDVMQKSSTEPLFTAKGVKEAVKHAIPLEYGEVSDIAPDVRLTLQNAGHILGSAIVHLHVGEGLHNIIYALDQKFGRTNLLDPAFTDFQRAETLIIESTYGASEDVFPPRYDVEKQLMSVVNSTMERGGICLVPSFSVERAQELMAILVENGFQYPVYLDGMIWDANGIFSAYPEYLGRAVQKKIFAGEDPFSNQMFKRIASKEDREKAWQDKPCMIVSTSGMLNGGPILEHLRMLAEDAKNTMIFVGYQAEGTLGRRIQKGWKEIPVKAENGKTISVPLNMEVYTAEGLSGHSDYRQLISYVARLSARPDKVVVLHGEPQKTVNLAKSLHKIFRVEAVAPRNLEAIRLK